MILPFVVLTDFYSAFNQDDFLNICIAYEDECDMILYVMCLITMLGSLCFCHCLAGPIGVKMKKNSR